jgi:hypothetical protein
VHDTEDRCLTIGISRFTLQSERLRHERALVFTDFVDERREKTRGERLA